MQLLPSGNELVTATDPNTSAPAPRFVRLFVTHSSGITASPATNLVATTDSPTEVTLKWDGNQLTGGFLIEKSVGGGDFEIIGYVPAGTNEFLVRNLIPGEEVTFRASSAGIATNLDTTPSNLAATTPTIGSEGAIILKFKNNESGIPNRLGFRIELENSTTSSIPLEELTIRYWMKNEDRPDPVKFRNDFSTVQGSGGSIDSDGISIVISPVNPPQKGADTSIDFIFAPGSGNLPARASNGNAGILEINGALIRNFQNGDFDPTNDFSYQEESSLQINNRINILRNGSLIFGQEPGGGSGGENRPVEPLALRTQTLSESSIELNWQDNANNETLYIIERNFQEDPDGFGIITTVAPNTTIYQDQNLLDNAEYLYRVRAVNASGVSSSTNIATGVTLEGTSPQFIPVAPSSLDISTFSSGRLDLSWTDSSRNENGFIIQRREPGSPFEEIARVPSGTTSFLDYGLTPGTTYDYQVLAFNKAGSLSSPSSDGDTNTTPTPRPLTDEEITRFLRQASFGATPALITEVRSLGFEGWIDAQFALTPTLHLPLTQAGGSDQAARIEAWWQTALTAPDQARQKLAFALSQILVVSQNDNDLADQALGLANYYDLLVNAPELGYRELLEQVTFSPIMGNYLDHTRNQRADPASNIRPDENYAREIMQLFSIGLNRLNLDGSTVNDSDGKPIPTYNQRDIEQVARVFTGLTFAGSTDFFTSAADYIQPMVLFPDFHESGSKIFSLLASDIPSILPLSAGADPLSDFEAIHDGLANHSSTAPFICRQLIQRTVTSNPSPAYIERISRVFLDNGSGQAGDLQAVFKAILLDYEARSLDPRDSTTHGKQREPIIRFCHLLRMLSPTPGINGYGIGDLTNRIQQAPLVAPSVFNFFEPDYALPGAIDRANLVSPEFQITQPATVIGAANLVNDLLFDTSSVGDITLDYSRYTDLATNISDLIEQLENDLMDGRMPSSMEFVISTYLGTLTDDIDRVQAAIYLVATSAEFIIEQ